MTYNEIVDHYGSLTKASQALEYSKQRISNWRHIRIPSDIQIRIAARTGLRADRQARREIEELTAAAAAAKRLKPA
jgi:hypothetical protein